MKKKELVVLSLVAVALIGTTVAVKSVSFADTDRQHEGTILPGVSGFDEGKVLSEEEMDTLLSKVESIGTHYGEFYRVESEDPSIPAEETVYDKQEVKPNTKQIIKEYGVFIKTAE
ncbi:hypothetical protein ACE3NQ_13650 [Paenibacillus terreus]|uniref:PASTA domain-containing protein n=1 Tax=Paenibacillus terreus TaxID=1387834 RepID=A0ABV5B8D7_9BACL